mmetsp:Transcript_5528/g.7619  ORF Transcript_5528/g.7619 Transcript_5528/m.7619 type:complete len:490 (+) Transcript_5528:240-1709(+)
MKTQNRSTTPPCLYDEEKDSFITRGSLLTKGGRLKSYEFINPVPGSDERQSGVFPAIFNLSSTILGGGILSLPFTFAKLGWGLGMVILVSVALASDFSLYILCSCSRRSGTISYMEVVKYSFGEAGYYFVTMMLSIFILLIVVAYNVLVRDIASGIVEFIIGYTLDTDDRDKVLICCIIFMSPLCFFNSLYSLRYTCYLGFCAMCVLAASLVYSSLQVNSAHPDLFAANAMVATSSVQDVLFVLPILAVSYVCQFNMLSVHCKLKHPTRQRIRTTIDCSIGVATLIYSIVAIAGYLYAYDKTSDNIFNNFASSDKLLLVGRLGLFITLMCAMPMMVLPCRENSLLLLGDTCKALKMCDTSATTEETLPLDPGLERQSFSEMTRELDKKDKCCGDPCGLLTHVMSTVGIVVFALYLAICIPGVAVVWSIAGSTLGLLFSFVLPAACYLKMRWEKKHSKVKVGAMIMLVLSSILMVFCTIQSVSRALASGS